jgi:hypothetical protein
MLDFEKYVARHGECAVQAIIEQAERHQGLRNRIGTPLEERWIAVMQPNSEQHQLAA